MKFKIINFFASIISYLLPHTRVVNFRTNEGIATNSYFVDKNAVRFCLLKKPILVKGSETNVTSKDVRYKGNWVNINFYNTDSVDRLIKKLEEVKTNIQISEIEDILNSGGTMVWNKVDDVPLPEGVSVEKYEITFQMPIKDTDVQGTNEVE